jgi:hypothetical protein
MYGDYAGADLSVGDQKNWEQRDFLKSGKKRAIAKIYS